MQTMASTLFFVSVTLLSVWLFAGVPSMTAPIARGEPSISFYNNDDSSKYLLGSIGFLKPAFSLVSTAVGGSVKSEAQKIRQQFSTVADEFGTKIDNVERNVAQIVSKEINVVQNRMQTEMKTLIHASKQELKTVAGSIERVKRELKEGLQSLETRMESVAFKAYEEAMYYGKYFFMGLGVVLGVVALGYCLPTLKAALNCLASCLVCCTECCNVCGGCMAKRHAVQQREMAVELRRMNALQHD